MFKAIAAISTAMLAFPFPGAPQDITPGSSGSTKPRFDVASVKECRPSDRAGSSRTFPGGLSLSCRNLKLLIQEAFDLFGSGKADVLSPGTPRFQVEGLPDWVNSSRYSIEAKTDSPQSAAMMRGPMMQALLEERFDLKVHLEKREAPVYLLTVAKGRPRLHEAPEGSCTPFDFSEGLNMVKSADQNFCAVPNITRRVGVTILDVHGVTLGGFSKMLHLEHSLIDQTGLNGAYDIHLEWGPDVPEESATAVGVAPDPSPAASLIVALREQLGLQVSSGRGINKVLMIDHIEKAGEN